MSRTYVVTGAASGIGLATKHLLEERGERVIGVDLRGSEIDADLSTEEGRAALPDLVAQASGGRGIDAVLAVAGVASFSGLTVRVNHFGAIATLESLRPLLSASATPRAAVVASFATLQGNDPELLAALRAGDEPLAIKIADRLAKSDAKHLIYSSTKRSIAEWMREASISDDWAAAGIPLNAVAPGIIVTAMTAPYLATPEGRASLYGAIPIRLGGGPAEPVAVARLLAWLTGEENTYVTGQLIFVDGGAEAVVRGTQVFDGAHLSAVELPTLGTRQ
ncbi:SDR family oxidoreductase [Arthrobacter sp. B0490]|uniref:SDR family oxidoreductase n=1 Tax=Arthrobacter sp. B0490 TaxID=2058891 RepID=UPI000CE52912|nr:SDR family oxidoreductase [Arthrobacter sp. B0490]